MPDDRGAPQVLAWIAEPPVALEEPAAAVQRTVTAVYANEPLGPRIEEGLRGHSWLGHPVHPLLTDVVTGAWTVAWTFDVLESLGMRRLRAGADAAVAIGLAAVPITAATGSADWHRASGVARRLGFLHAMLNTAASVLYICSMVQRLRGRRRSAVAWGHMGFALMNISAYLGGELTYSHGMNVERREPAAGARMDGGLPVMDA